MRNIALAGSALMLVLSGGSALAGPTAKSLGINIDLANSTTLGGTPTNFLIKGKYLISQDMAVLAGAGLQLVDDGLPANNRATNLGLMGGIRKYMKTDDFAPFLGGKLQYLITRQGTTDVTDLALMAEFGAEYFLGKQFSLEGAVAAGYASQKIEPVAGPGSTTSTALGTATYSVSANYYF